MFTQSASLYDAIYHWKDYAEESRRLKALIAAHKRSLGNTLLDVACGTGAHVPYLRDDFACEGLDLDAQMLALAAERHPDTAFHHGNMIDFDLGRQFDIVTCLFTSIAYTKTPEAMAQAIATMARHVLPGGVLVVEPFIAPAQWEAGRPSATFVDQPQLKVARMHVAQREGDLAILDFHYLVARPAGIQHFSERHELGLFTDAAYRDALAATGLAATYNPEGLIGRGLYIATKPL